MLNHATIMGRLARDPELRRTGSGVAVASFTVAVDRDFENDGEREADFIECVAWRSLGEFVARNFHKGKMIVVSGRIQQRKWTDKDGNKRRAAEVLAENVYFADSKSESGENQANTGGFTPPAYPTPGYAPPAGEFAPLDDEDAQLPF